MPLVFRRIAALTVKEFLAILRDPRGRVVLVMAPLIQLLVFSFAATLEVKNVSLSILNEDQGLHSAEIIQRIAGSRTFSDLTFVSDIGEFDTLIDRQKVLAAIHIPQDFSRNIESGQGAALQIVYDGRRSNAAQIVHSYLTRVAGQYSAELTAGRETAVSLAVSERYWFNENLDYIWFTIPSLVAILTMVITVSQAGMSVARERELGTFDQLLVSPLMPAEILAGKVIPAMVIGVAEALLIFFMGRLVFGVPFRGSFPLMVWSIGLFAFSIVGFGLFISSLAKTQQQAILGAFILLVPAISLSGFAAPVENMPGWLQIVTWPNPMRHALILFKGLFLKDMPFSEVLAESWPLAAVGAATLVFAGWMFTRKLE